MKNFIDRLEFIVTPSLFHTKYGDAVEIEVRFKKNGTEYAVRRMEDYDFLKSNFDVVFDYIKAAVKESLEQLENE